MTIAPESIAIHKPERIAMIICRLLPLVVLMPIFIVQAGCQPATSKRTPSGDPNSPTNIAIGTKVIRSGVKRFGMNISGQTYYDSGIMMRDLTFQNPGFEGEIWQTILQCKFVNGDSCADNDEWSAWPKDFAKGGTFEFFFGQAKGQRGVVAGNTIAASAQHQGVWVSFGALGVHPKVGDFYILRMKFPGNADAGWRTSADGGATITTETQDLSPSSPGKQALRLTADGSAQTASITSDVDTWADRSFVQLKGSYTLSFRAKGAGGSNTISASVTRLTKSRGAMTYITHQVQLTPAWQDYKFTFEGHEDGTFIGPILVTLGVHAGSALLDDVSLTEAAKPDNPTAFRDAVVDRLRELRPGILRYMDNGTSFGSSIDNLLAPTYARVRAGYSEGNKEQGNIPIGLHDFIVLCQAVKAEPWISLPAAMTPAEMKNLIEYIAGPASSPYGAKRSALGQSAPWTQVFSAIHLELGNETWNVGSFPGESMGEPRAYATRVSEVFAAARIAPYYDSSKFDLIMNGWYAVPWWSEQQLSMKTYADTLDIAPYTFNPFNDTSSTEAIFGPMFAEPESLDSRPKGMVAVDAKLAEKYGVKLAVYEVNLGTTQGKATQSILDSTIPSVGAGLSVADHMLLMLRDDGVINQALFCLPEFANGYDNSEVPNSKELVQLWGSVVDLGGQTNRVRPTFLAEELANSALFGNMLETSQSGSDPTWDQPKSTNAEIKLDGAHMIQSFAFTDGGRSSVVIFNLSRNAKLPVILSGQAPHAAVQESRLTSANITDTNELAQKVSIKHQNLPSFDPSVPYWLPPYSMTVLSWDAAGSHSTSPQSKP